MTHFVYKSLRQVKLFVFIFINEDVGIKKAFSWLPFSGSINRSYCMALQVSLGGEKDEKYWLPIQGLTIAKQVA